MPEAKPSAPSGPSRTSSPRPGRGPRKTDAPHLDHVKDHLRRLAEGLSAVSAPEQIFVGRDDGPHFQEVVGLRLEGHPTMVLAALRFQRHDLPGTEYARESLNAYLSSPPAPTSSPYEGARQGEISAYLPRWHVSIPAFLEQLRDGPDYAPVHFSPDLIQVAFDLRMSNPSGMESVKQRAGAMTPHLFRTRGGHVLRGNSHGRRQSLGSGHRFIAVTECEQLTPGGRIRLPSVMLHRDFVAMAVPLADEKTRLAAPNWTPFLPVTATGRHLLFG